MFRRPSEPAPGECTRVRGADGRRRLWGSVRAGGDRLCCRKPVRRLFGLLLLSAVLLGADSGQAVEPHHSFDEIVSGNGYSVVGFNTADSGRRMDAYMEHPYRFPDSQSQTRDLCYDAYFGLRVGSQSGWLTEQPIDEAGYEQKTGFISVRQHVGDLDCTTVLWAPLGMDGPGAVLMLEVHNGAGTASQPVTLYSIHNFHLGSGAPDSGSDSERIQWTSGMFVETGPSGLSLAAVPVPAATHHAASPNNPYPVVSAGGDLVDTDDSGTMEDAVSGFQWDVGSIGPDQVVRVAVLFGHANHQDQAALLTRLSTYVQGKQPMDLHTQDVLDWAGWLTEPPAGLSPEEKQLWTQSEVILRMAQVREPGRGFGQILASLPPGNWNIAWVRDMCYAAVALARSGHPQEAWDALTFMLNADSGHYQEQVGHPYLISVTRYFGNGAEESDSNENGPNIEFDGFGLFLWALDEVLTDWPEVPWTSFWPSVRDQVADVLVALVDPATGLIKPDSSIWEVHWNGQQKHYAYTSLAAANGLCAAAHLALAAGDQDRADLYQQTSLQIRQALVDRCTDEHGVLAQSYEELTDQTGYLDAAVVEALNWGLLDPEGRVANATLDRLVTGLRPASGRGFYRNDDGGWYDSQEWVFVDLRSALAFHLAGRSAVATDLLHWVTDQSSLNYDLVSELYDASSADYQGEAPMVGFGAGAFILAAGAVAADRQPEPSCGAYASESDAGLDGSVAGDGGARDGAVEDDGGSDGSTGGGGGGGGCSCHAEGGPGGLAWWMLAALMWMALIRRRGGRRERREGDER
ncbi:MAG: hypothetical protein J7M25_08310 [Deltaproteobacteria bacterium]|nr:hypothetical protein [Deltaproteobacteria bacterium]